MSPPRKEHFKSKTLLCALVPCSSSPLSFLTQKHSSSVHCVVLKNPSSSHCVKYSDESSCARRWHSLRNVSGIMKDRSVMIIIKQFLTPLFFWETRFFFILHIKMSLEKFNYLDRFRSLYTKKRKFSFKQFKINS